MQTLKLSPCPRCKGTGQVKYIHTDRVMNIVRHRETWKTCGWCWGRKVELADDRNPNHWLHERPGAE